MKTKLVKFTQRAINDLQRIKEFSTKLWGLEKSEIIIDTIFYECEKLENSEIDITEFGAVDEEFEHLKYKYRKLIIHHCKVTYRIGASAIYVVRVFDTRQNPKKNL